MSRNHIVLRANSKNPTMKNKRSYHRVTILIDTGAYLFRGEVIKLKDQNFNLVFYEIIIFL